MKRLRWWLAVVLADWAHSFTAAEIGDAWLVEFTTAYLRARKMRSGPIDDTNVSLSGRPVE
jgi:hypothetical protein